MNESIVRCIDMLVKIIKIQTQKKIIFLGTGISIVFHSAFIYTYKPVKGSYLPINKTGLVIWGLVKYN